MINIIEDTLSQLIDTKLKYLSANPSFISAILNIDSTKASRLTQYLQTTPIKIIRGFPRTQAELPGICILLSNEEETQESLGNVSFDETQTETIYSSDYRLEIWTENGDLTVQLYHLLKWCILSGRDDLANVGMFNQRIGGTDFEPAPEYFPIFVYRRALTFWCQSVVSVPIIQTTEQSIDVTGIVATAIPFSVDISTTVEG
ncbi:MAG: hypothetical protein Q8910_00825 [Bacteroidota bacterium]|nr:hypothetical protein [Bacteroidota bacterium]